MHTWPLAQDRATHISMPGPWLVLDNRAAIDITCVQTFQISRNPEKATRVQGEVLAFELGSKEPQKVVDLGKYQSGEALCNVPVDPKRKEAPAASFGTKRSQQGRPEDLYRRQEEA